MRAGEEVDDAFERDGKAVYQQECSGCCDGSIVKLAAAEEDVDEGVANEGEGDRGESCGGKDCERFFADGLGELFVVFLGRGVREVCESGERDRNADEADRDALEITCKCVDGYGSFF